MPARKYRKPKCLCGTTLVNGRCPHGCERFAKPRKRIRDAERGRPEEPVILLSAKEVRASCERIGLPKLDPTPVLPRRSDLFLGAL